MPEGDTIWRAAARLKPVLVGQELDSFEARRMRGLRPRLGSVIEDVEAVGKHLLVHFDNGLSLDTHMRMTGSWHVYPAGHAWSKPRHRMSCRIAVVDWEAVCFNAPVVQTYARRDVMRSPIAHLGPDLCRDDVDLDAAVGRMALRPDVSIAEALLDQTVAAGIGNIYKSEVLFACGVNPFIPVSDVPVDERRRLLEVASALLRQNLTTSRRTTAAGPPGTVAVYRRDRRSCRRCGTPIRMMRHGEQNRSTYWCPTCQPE